LIYSIRYLVLFYFFSATLILAHDEKEAANWKTWSNAGIASNASTAGLTGIFRINRTTENTFRDVRLFGYALGSDSYFYLRYKSSSKYRKPLDRFYYFSTLSFQRNTINNISLRSHYNQGFGSFLAQYDSGHLNIELGHAFDMADYLNDTRKTSYLKSGIYLDQDIFKSALKMDAEYFYQISEIVEKENLSRYEIIVSWTRPLPKNMYVTLGYELEHIQNNDTQSSSLFILLGWKQRLKWTF